MCVNVSLPYSALSLVFIYGIPGLLYLRHHLCQSFLNLRKQQHRVRGVPTIIPISVNRQKTAKKRDHYLLFLLQGLISPLHPDIQPAELVLKL